MVYYDEYLRAVPFNKKILGWIKNSRNSHQRTCLICWYAEFPSIILPKTIPAK